MMMKHIPFSVLAASAVLVLAAFCAAACRVFMKKPKSAAGKSAAGKADRAGRIQKAQDAKRDRRKLASLRYRNMYRIFISHKVVSRLSKRYIIRLTKRLSMLSVYTRDEIQAGAAKFTLRLFAAVMGTFAASCMVFNDIVSVLLCTVFAYIYVQTSIERSIEATTLRVYRELKNAVASIRIEYKKGNSDVLVALENAKYGNRIAPVIEDLKSVLTAADPEEALTEYYEKIPFKQVQTLAMICYNIANNGDSLDKYNNSTFDEAMLLMNSDINQKIEQMHYERIKFKRLEDLALIGIAASIAFRYGMAYIMPSIEVVYNSMMGFLIQNGVILFSMIRYYGIAHAHLASVLVNDDRLDIVRALMGRKAIERFVHTIAPKGRKRRILTRRLQLSFSKKSADSFWCEKCLYAAAAFLCVLIVVVTSPITERKFLYSYTDSFDMMADNTVYKDAGVSKEEICEMDLKYMAQRDAGLWNADSNGNLADEELIEAARMVREYIPRISTMQLQDTMKRMETKYRKINAVQFHWYMILLCYAAAFLAFRAPDRTLKKRLSVAREEEEEEFLQLQIVTMILAAMDLDTLEAIGHLAQIADIHKPVLTRCYYGYAANPVEELERVESSTQSENFKQFIFRMKETVEDLSLKEAFADLASDREHICAERNDYIKDNINQRRNKAGLQALQPMNFAIYGMMVFPLVYTGITDLMAAMSQLSAL